MSRPVATETCSCGASIEVAARGAADVLAAWRKSHRCTKPLPVAPGICGDQTEPDPVGKRYICNLLYGHRGWHRYTDGWQTVDWAWVLDVKSARS
jgi:hypothetical protein